MPDLEETNHWWFWNEAKTAEWRIRTYGADLEKYLLYNRERVKELKKVPPAIPGSPLEKHEHTRWEFAQLSIVELEADEKKMLAEQDRLKAVLADKFDKLNLLRETYGLPTLISLGGSHADDYRTSREVEPPKEATPSTLVVPKIPTTNTAGIIGKVTKPSLL